MYIGIQDTLSAVSTCALCSDFSVWSTTLELGVWQSLPNISFNMEMAVKTGDWKDKYNELL